MPKLSKFNLENKREKATIKLLFDSLTLLENRGEVEFFFRDLFTPTEIRMLGKRLAITKMLIEGYDYQTISSFLRVTHSTISEMSKKVKYGRGGLDLALERIFKIEKQKQKRVEGNANLLKPPPGGVNPSKFLDVIDKEIKKRSKRGSVTNR